MEIKEIALKLCNLPDGNYKIKTKFGDMDITHLKLSNRNDFKQINIQINGELYTQFIYSTFDYFHLWEKIYKKNNDQKYVLKHEILENKNEIEYTDENNETFKITDNIIYNYTNETLCGSSYNVINNMFKKMVTSSDDSTFIYNLKNNEKILYIRKNNNNNSIIEENSISISGDIYKFITKYNELVDLMNINTKTATVNQNELNAFTNNRFIELIESYLIPNINLEKIKKQDAEIEKYVKIYKEYIPKLTEHHSKEMIKTLEAIAVFLENKYNSNKENSEINKEPKNKEFTLVPINK